MALFWKQNILQSVETRHSWSRVFVYDVTSLNRAPKVQSKTKKVHLKQCSEERHCLKILSKKFVKSSSYKVLCDIKWIVGNMEDLSQDWDSGSDMAASPSPSISSQASMITANGTKKAINRGRWTKEEVRLRLFKII